jgi:hypothetical protein
MLLDATRGCAAIADRREETMAESSLARRSEWWPGRRMTEWFDWLDWPGFATSREGERMIRIEELRDGDATTCTRSGSSRRSSSGRAARSTA